MSTPLPELDRGAADAFWRRYLAATGAATAPAYTDLTCFGDSVELADELIALVIEGRKRATAASVAEYEAEGVTLPEVGDWLRAHTDYFERSHTRLGVGFGPDMPVVFERFEVSYAEPA